jgi:hypothetical protein
MSLISYSKAMRTFYICFPYFPSFVFVLMRLFFDGVLSRGSVVGWGTMLQTGRSPVQVPNKVDFSILPTALWPWGRLSL